MAPVTASQRVRPHLVLWLLAIVAALVGCASPKGSAPDASSHPESVLIDFYDDAHVTAACSGTLIAPRVVLTAAHCADGAKGARVRAPFAGGQSAAVEQSMPFDWSSTAVAKNVRAHDVTLLVLKQPITLARYARIQANACPGCAVTHVARSSGQLVQIAGARMSNVTSAARPHELLVSKASNDAGGALLRATPSGTEIVGVMVGRGTKSGYGYAARLDNGDLQGWIRHVVAMTAPPAAATSTKSAHLLDDPVDGTGDPPASDPVDTSSSSSSGGGSTSGDPSASSSSGGDPSASSSGAGGDTSFSSSSSSSGSSGGSPVDDPPDVPGATAPVASGDGDSAHSDPTAADAGAPDGATPAAANGADTWTPGGKDEEVGGDASTFRTPDAWWQNPKDATGEYAGSGIKVANQQQYDMYIKTGSNFWGAVPNEQRGLLDQTSKFFDKVGDQAFFIASHGDEGTIETLPPKDAVQPAVDAGKPLVMNVCYAGQSTDKYGGDSLIGKYADAVGASRDSVFGCTGEVGTHGDCDGVWVDGNGQMRKPPVQGAKFPQSGAGYI